MGAAIGQPMKRRAKARGSRMRRDLMRGGAGEGVGKREREKREVVAGGVGLRGLGRMI